MAANEDLTLEGHQIHWYWQDSDSGFFDHETTFLSCALYNKYRRYSFSVRKQPFLLKGTVDSVSAVSVSDIQEVLQNPAARLEVTPQMPDIVEVLYTEAIAEHQWEEAIMSAELRNQIQSGQITNLYYLVASATAAVAELQEHVSHERFLRQNQKSLSDSPSAPKYSGPLFAYSIDIDTEEVKPDNLIKRESPINVAWHTDLNMNAQNIIQTMKTNGWDGFSTSFSQLSETRYAIINTGKTPHLQKENSHAGKQAGLPSVLSPDQWHCRGFDIPSAMDQIHDVAGQTHQDPIDHGQFGSPNWKYSQSRQEVESDWKRWGYSSTTPYIGNEDNFSSSQGRKCQILL